MSGVSVECCSCAAFDAVVWCGKQSGCLPFSFCLHSARLPLPLAITRRGKGGTNAAHVLDLRLSYKVTGGVSLDLSSAAAPNLFRAPSLTRASFMLCSFSPLSRLLGLPLMASGNGRGPFLGPLAGGEPRSCSLATTAKRRRPFGGFVRLPPSASRWARLANWIPRSDV